MSFKVFWVWIGVGFGILGFASASPAGAQQGNAGAVAVKVAVINMELIVREAKARASIDSQLEESRQKMIGEARKEEEKLRQAEEELVSQRNILSPEAHRQKEEEYNKKVVEAQRLLQAHRVAIVEAERKAMRDFQAVLSEVVSSVTKEHGITLLFRLKGVVLAHPQFDITPIVLAGLNRDLPSVPLTVNWPTTGN